MHIITPEKMLFRYKFQSNNIKMVNLNRISFPNDANSHLIIQSIGNIDKKSPWANIGD